MKLVDFEEESSQKSQGAFSHLPSAVMEKINRHLGFVKFMFWGFICLTGTFTISQVYSPSLWHSHDERQMSFCWDYSDVILRKEKEAPQRVLPVATERDISPLCLGPPALPPKWLYHTAHNIFLDNLHALEKSVKKAIDFGCMSGWNFDQEIHLFMGPVKPSPLKSNKLTVWYQTEQNGSAINQSPGFRQSFKEATFIWDFSRFNVWRFEKEFGALPANKGGQTFYVPFWTAVSEKFFSKRLVQKKKKYDVLLFGLITPRRAQICGELKEHGVETICGTF